MVKSRSLNDGLVMNDICSSTDAALAWLLSLSATCSSSPFRPSSSPTHYSFTDWIQLSPSPSPTKPTDSALELPSQDRIFSTPSSKDYRDLAYSDSLQCFSHSPFESDLNLYDPAVPLSLSDVSPVVRASRKVEESLVIEKERKELKTRNSKKSSLLEKLQSVCPNTPQQRRHLPFPASDLALLDVSSATGSALLSPQATFRMSPLPIPAPVFTTPPRPSATTNIPLSPLSPLTPLSSPTISEPSHPPSLKIKIVLKRKHSDTNPATPIRRSKRPRRSRNVAVVLSSSPLPSQQKNDGPFDEEQGPDPIYTKRTLPTNIEISSAFPLLYRRFPASTYYQPPDEDSPCSLFGLTHPGGNYNPPRKAFDLYTPRFVKGKGVEKVGLCPICVESVSRGGENKRLWLAMKFSAFKCYHMQYAHGISASTGKPFSPPTAFRVVPRQNAGKNEKHRIQEGKCHKCSKWVVVEGIKDMESKVPELYWWKHAATCHHDSTLEGEGDYFEQDDIYAKLITIERPDA